MVTQPQSIHNGLTMPPLGSQARSRQTNSEWQTSDSEYLTPSRSRSLSSASSTSSSSQLSEKEYSTQEEATLLEALFPTEGREHGNYLTKKYTTIDPETYREPPVNVKPYHERVKEYDEWRDKKACAGKIERQSLTEEVSTISELQQKILGRVITRKASSLSQHGEEPQSTVTTCDPIQSEKVDFSSGTSTPLKTSTSSQNPMTSELGIYQIWFTYDESCTYVPGNTWTHRVGNCLLKFSEPAHTTSYREIQSMIYDLLLNQDGVRDRLLHGLEVPPDQFGWWRDPIIYVNTSEHYNETAVFDDYELKESIDQMSTSRGRGCYFRASWTKEDLLSSRSNRVAEDGLCDA